MNYIAHAGETHETAAEAAAHTSSTTFITVALISLAVVLFVVALVYVLKRFSILDLPTKKSKEE